MRGNGLGGASGGRLDGVLNGLDAVETVGHVAEDVQILLIVDDELLYLMEQEPHFCGLGVAIHGQTFRTVSISASAGASVPLTFVRKNSTASSMSMQSAISVQPNRPDIVDQEMENVIGGSSGPESVSGECKDVAVVVRLNADGLTVHQRHVVENPHAGGN